MADSSVPITAGTGTNIDTFTQASGDHRQAVVIGDATAAATTKINTDGSLAAAITNPVGGASALFRPDNLLRVANDPTSLLLDTFEYLDTNTWTVSGTAVPTVASGNLSVAVGTSASATSIIRSVPAFTNGANAYLNYVSAFVLDAAAITNNKRVWGLAVPQTTPTTASPVLNGVVFELQDTDGALVAAVYSNGTRTQTTALTRATDGGPHRYSIYFRASRVFYEIDSLLVASLAYPNPQVDALPAVAVSVNAATAPGSAPTLAASVVGVADTGRNNTQISDGTYPWRKVQVRSDGLLNVNMAASAGNVAATSGTLTNVTNSAVTANVTTAGNCTVSFIGGSYANLPFVFEASPDNQTSWFTVAAQQLDGTGVNTTWTVPASGGPRSWNIGCPGFTHVRVRLTGTAGTFTTSPTVLVTQGPFLWAPSPTVAPIDGQKATYTSYTNNLASNFAGDFWALLSSSTKTVRMTRLEVGLTVSGTITAGGNVLTLLKRTSAYSGGTAGTAPTLGPMDTADPAVTASNLTYTAAPTPGTLSTTVRAMRFVSAAQTYYWTWDFGNRPSRAPMIRNPTQCLSLNLSAAFAGTSPVTAWTILAEFTEE